MGLEGKPSVFLPPAGAPCLEFWLSHGGKWVESVGDPALGFGEPAEEHTHTITEDFRLLVRMKIAKCRVPLT